MMSHLPISTAVPSLVFPRYKKHVTVALSGDGGDESFLGLSLDIIG